MICFCNRNRGPCFCVAMTDFPPSQDDTNVAEEEAQTTSIAAVNSDSGSDSDTTSSPTTTTALTLQPSPSRSAQPTPTPTLATETKTCLHIRKLHPSFIMTKQCEFVRASDSMK